MNSISITYTLVWKLSYADNYQWTKDGKCFNVLTGKQIKQCYNSGCIGYYIKGKFHSLKHLRKQLIKINNIRIPF